MGSSGFLTFVAGGPGEGGDCCGGIRGSTLHVPGPVSWGPSPPPLLPSCIEEFPRLAVHVTSVSHFLPLAPSHCRAQGLAQPPAWTHNAPPPQARPEPKIWKWAGKGKSWRLGPSLGLSGWMGVVDRVQERNAEVERGGGGNLESLTLDTWSITARFHLLTEHLVCASHYPTLHSLSPQSGLVLTASL